MCAHRSPNSGFCSLEEESSISRYNRTSIGHNMAATQALGLQCVWGPATKQKRETPSFLVIDPGFPCSSAGKESSCNAGDLGLIPGLRRSPGEGNGNPLKYSCLENPKDKGAWQATVQESDSWTLSWTPTVQGIARVGHDLLTKPPPSPKGQGLLT